MSLAPVPMINYFGYLFDAANWTLTGDSSIPLRIAQHLEYAFLAMVVSAAIALPLGLLIGHTNRGAFIAITAGNLGR
jgi:osmoprotectant transport system permease protein